MNKNITNRLNRARIEWARFLSPAEYVLMDKILFQSNLTYANEGEGFKFHVRTLAKECSMPASTVSEVLQQWPFVRKKGEAKGMIIQLDYKACVEWIVHMANNHGVIVRLLDNDCSPNGPRSNTSKGTCTEPPDLTLLPSATATETEKTGTTGLAERSEVLEAPAGVQASPVDGTKAIVRLMDNKKPPLFVAVEIERSELPKGIKNIPSPIRQRAIVTMLNANRFQFDLTKSGWDGYKSCAAIDETNKIILITADDTSFIESKGNQGMCDHFQNKGYKIILWTADTQTFYRVAKANTPLTTPTPDKTAPANNEDNPDRPSDSELWDYCAKEICERLYSDLDSSVRQVIQEMVASDRKTVETKYQADNANN